jgi:hypothetical protein
MKTTIIALAILAAVATALVATPPHAIVILLLASAVFGARALAVWPGATLDWNAAQGEAAAA